MSRQVVGGQPAPRRAESGDVVKHPILRLAGKVSNHQPLEQKLGTNCEKVGYPTASDVGEFEVAARQPGEQLDAGRAHQRFANGSLMIGFARRLAAALAEATIVAVTPTLVARSQVSLSVRCMMSFSFWVQTLSGFSHHVQHRRRGEQLGAGTDHVHHPQEFLDHYRLGLRGCQHLVQEGVA